MTFYVQIPCSVSHTQPNVTAAPTRVLTVQVEAESELEAARKVSEEISWLVRPWGPKRP
jgi:hypothetical protein